MYIDIHSHLIFDVDDGSKSLEQSIKYLKEIKKMNLNKVICTPHMYYGRREKILKIVENFKILREEARKLGIELYLGNEILYNEKTLELLQNKKLTTLNKSDYLLIEFKRSESMDIDSLIDSLEEFIEAGYKVVLAHPELYINYRSISYMKRIKEIGVMLQIDATSILRSKTNSKVYKFAKSLLKEKLVDIVASDSHCTKERNFSSLKDAYKQIYKKDKNYANIIFYENPLKIIEKN